MLQALSLPTRDKFSECELDGSVRTRDVRSTVMPTAGNMTTVVTAAAGNGRARRYRRRRSGDYEDLNTRQTRLLERREDVECKKGEQMQE